MAVEATEGDYRYKLVKNDDGTYKCTRRLRDDSSGHSEEELDDWTQLPPSVYAAFTRAQNQAA
jgi:hypothetical protein